HDSTTTLLSTVYLHDALPICIHAKTNTSMNARRMLAALALVVWPPVVKPALFHRSDASAPRGSAITLRKRLHINTLITAPATMEDRKSTRLNSSHVSISYAVF